MGGALSFCFFDVIFSFTTSRVGQVGLWQEEEENTELGKVGPESSASLPWPQQRCLE